MKRRPAATTLAVLAAIGLARPAAASLQTPARAALGAPDVSVAFESGLWTIRGARHVVSLDPVDLRLTVRTPRLIWRFRPSADGDLTVFVPRSLVRNGSTSGPPPGSTAGLRAGSSPPVSLRLADAEDKTVEPYRTGYLAGIKVELSGFELPLRPAAQKTKAEGDGTAPASRSDTPVPPFPSSSADLRLQIFIGLEGREEDLVVRIGASDGAVRVRELCFPPSLEPDSFDHAVVPFMQGLLLPKAWSRPVKLYDSISYGRGLYMPWWGFQQADGAVLVLLETPADAGARFEHPAGGPTRADVRWLHSLGRWSYPRSVRCAFFDEGNYVALAKRYRRAVIENGRFVSLKEKIARNPLVGRLVGSPIIHTSILYHIQPESSYYRKDDPAANHQLVSFDDRIAELRRLAARGVDKAYLHLDGWGVRGYDNLHPDILPPCPEAGGWAGMVRFADACEELGIVFAVHDQYRDFYLDAASYEPRHAVLEEDGTRQEHATWYGGKQSLLCPSLAPGYVRRNFRGLLGQGVKVRGAYLDVFAVVPGDECYSPEHPVTREDCLRFRGECLDFVRSFGGVVSSEEPADWALPRLDLVHHAPHALDPNPGAGPAIGIPVPLYSLVYHDALCVPWSLGRGAWGIPEKDLGFLYGMGNAGLPYLSIAPADEELARVREMCALHERVGLLELVSHEFLDANPRRQVFTYADGTRVQIDLDADTVAVVPPVR
jgi:hypothetical protein